MRRPLLPLFAAALLASLLAPAVANAAVSGSTSAAGSPPSSPAAPSATIGSVDCVHGGAYATMSNAGGQPTTFTIQRDGATIDTVTLGRSSGAATRLVPIAEGLSSVVTVQMSGAGYVSGRVTRDCITRTAPEPAGLFTGTPAAAPVRAPKTRGADLAPATPRAWPFPGSPGMGVAGAIVALLLAGGAALHLRNSRKVPAARRPG